MILVEMLINGVGENIIGAPKMQNSFNAI